MKEKISLKALFCDFSVAVLAGIVVGTAYHFFQNSNGFAPGGVGGLATITHHLLEGKISWSILMLAFNLPIFVILAAYVDRRLGFILAVYMCVQSAMPALYGLTGALPYSLANSGEDFKIAEGKGETGDVGEGDQLHFCGAPFEKKQNIFGNMIQHLCTKVHIFHKKPLEFFQSMV